MRFRKGSRKKQGKARGIRRRADVEKVLAGLGIDFERKPDDDLYAICPNPGHPEKGPSWHIRAVPGDDKNGVFNCWSCKWSGDLFDLVMKIKGCDFPAALEFVEASAIQAMPADAVASPDDYLRDMGPCEPPGIGYEWPDREGTLRPFKPTRIRPGCVCSSYLTGRLIGQQYIDRYGLLDWQEMSRVIVPITRGARLISWVARSYNGRNPKTFAPKGAPKLWELFGLDQLDRSTPEVNLAEGWADAIRLAQIGVPNPLAICGSSLTEYQVDDILFARKITIWMDGDRAGRALSEDAVAWLDREFHVVELPEKTDPGDYHPGDLAKFESQNWKTFRGGRDD